MWYERRQISDTCERDGFTMTFHSEHRLLGDYTDAVFEDELLVEKLREIGEGDPCRRVEPNTVVLAHNEHCAREPPVHSSAATFERLSGHRSIRSRCGRGRQ
ncbi:MAG TPA: hypothetical protein VMD59_01140 [Acidimicrobiales bacterium]|nr:hypothetical protein [Acidimicrobiales bacterium]